jgi:hypothetical protein
MVNPARKTSLPNGYISATSKGTRTFTAYTGTFCRRQNHTKSRLKVGWFKSLCLKNSPDGRIALAAWVISSTGERCLHTADVTGSIPLSPTTSPKAQRKADSRVYPANVQALHNPLNSSTSANRIVCKTKLLHLLGVINIPAINYHVLRH